MFVVMLVAKVRTIDLVFKTPYVSRSSPIEPPT